MKNLKALKQTWRLALLALACLLPGAAGAQVFWMDPGFNVISGASKNILSWDLTGSDFIGNLYFGTGQYPDPDDFQDLAAVSYDDNALGFTDTGVTPGLTYYYQIAGTQAGEISISTPIVVAIPLANHGYYVFLNGLSGLALGSGGGAAVQQNFSGTNQLWYLVSQDGEHFAILDPDSGLALSGTETNAQLTLASYTGDNNQLWYFEVATNSDYNIYNAGTGQVLDDSGNSLAEGSPIYQWSGNGGSNQLWAATQAKPPGLTGIALNNNGSASQYTFSGELIPNALATTIICSLGTDTNYSGVSVTNVFPPSLTPTNFSFTVSYPVDNATVQARVTAINAMGTAVTNLTFVIGTPQIQSPELNVASVLQGNVSAQVNPNNLATTVVMQFGTTTAYGQAVTNTLGADGSYQSLTNLFAFPNQNFGTTLHAFITASNVAGIVTSGDFTFTVGPALVDMAAVNVNSVLTADVSEAIHPNGFPTTVNVLFGTSIDYNQFGEFSLSSGNFYQAVNSAFNYAALSGVSNVYARIVASNVEGGTNVYVSFPVGPPLIQSAAFNVGSVQQAAASGQVNPNGFPTTVIIEFGTNSAYGQSVTNTLNNNNINQSVADVFSYPLLAGATTLHARIIASNSAGTTTGNDLTLAIGPPLIQSAALNVASVLQATASGQVDPNGFPTTVITQFGTNTDYGLAITNILGSNNLYQGITSTFAFPSLGGATTLHALITAINAGGASTSGDLTLVVGPPLLQNIVAVSQGITPEAEISAQVTPNGFPTTVVIQFGTNTDYGMTMTDVLGTTNFYQLASASFTELSYNVAVTLHALITASNSAGTVSSGDLSFSSLPFEETYSSDFDTANLLYPVTGVVIWADMDNNGWLDLACDGQSTISSGTGLIYYNPGTNPTFLSVESKLPNGCRPALVVGDFDNDNRPDLFFACATYGSANTPQFLPAFNCYSGILYGGNIAYNVDNGMYAIITNSSWTPYLDVLNANVVVGDFDHTGRQDALVSGMFMDPSNTASEFTAVYPWVGPFSLLYQNNEPGGRNLRVQGSPGPVPVDQAMVPVNTRIPFVGNYDEGVLPSSGESALVAGDFDNDGFLDIFALNFMLDDTQAQYGGFFHGDGNKDFIPTSRFRLFPGYVGYGGVDSVANNIETASCVLADLNGDGYLDMVLSYQDTDGDFAGATVVSIWLNDGHGNLTNSNIVLPQLALANLAVGDIFNHGRNDILMVGSTDEDEGAQTLVLRNDGNGIFTPIVLGNFGVVGATGHGLALADYDNDGRLDFAMTGDKLPYGNTEYASFVPGTYIFRNEMNIPSNAPPAAPPGLATTVGNGTVTFHWGDATDDITPAKLLTYNLRVGTNSMDTSVVSPLANVTNGWRKIVAPGNCGHINNTLYRFPPGTYYWSVQAVDGGFKGGAWAPEQTFTITNPEPAVLTLNQPANEPYLGPNLTPANISKLLPPFTPMNISTNPFYVVANSNLLNVSWPTRFQGWTLEQSPSLVNPVWTTNTNVGTLNGKWSALVTPGGAATFFRLVGPAQ